MHQRRSSTERLAKCEHPSRLALPRCSAYTLSATTVCRSLIDAHRRLPLATSPVHLPNFANRGHWLQRTRHQYLLPGPSRPHLTVPDNVKLGFCSSSNWLMRSKMSSPMVARMDYGRRDCHRRQPYRRRKTSNCRSFLTTLTSACQCYGASFLRQ